MPPTVVSPAAPPLKVMKHDFNRERLLYALNQRIVLSGERPDVLLIVNQHHLLSALPHLLHRSLRIPDDLSLVFLSNDHATERLGPLPDRYDLGDRLGGGWRLPSWLVSLARCLLPLMVKGETLMSCNA